MNFFEAQDRTRRNTRRLIFLFAVATLLIAAAVTVAFELTLFGSGLTQGSAPFSQPLRSLAIAGSVLGFILLASGYRITQLSGGGSRVAQEMGGTLVNTDSPDLGRQRLRNVVEEMAIASGVPVPQIFVLEEESAINAFAAGFSPADAAVAVTRGALEELNRDELQGVIAHEFSHILNGDMRLNVRLMGVLFGIIVIGQIGRIMLRSGFGRRRVRISSNNRNGHVAVLAIGVSLFVLGSIGVMMARLIRAGVSRQREYLADASAVQFTRQTSGIAGALAKIAGLGAGSQLTKADAEEVSHMLFAEGARHAWLNAMASHPPLHERIRALDASLVSDDVIRAPRQQSGTGEPGLVSALAGAGQQPLEATAVANADRVGNPGDAEVALAGAIRRSIPASVYDAAHSREWAFYLAIAIGLDDDGDIRERQLGVLLPRIGESRCRRVGDYADTVAELGSRYRLPLLELCFPALKERPAGQLRFLLDLIDVVHGVLPEPGLHEYAFRQLLLHSLDASLYPSHKSRFRATHFGKKRSAEAAVDLLWIVAAHGHSDANAAQQAFRHGLAELGLPEASGGRRALVATSDILHDLNGLIGRDMQRLLAGLISTISHDGKITLDESELMRLVSAALDCPLPPIVDEPLKQLLRDDPQSAYS